MHPRAREDFLQAALAPDRSLADAALRIARVEHASFDPAPYVAMLDEMGRAARQRVQTAERQTPAHTARIVALTDYVYGALGFSGDRERYEDPRNSFLHDVLERRSGIPITLAVVLLEVGRRAGVELEGVNFPGHFLVRAPAAGDGQDLLIDPFHDGALVSEPDCEQLLRTHVGDEAVLSRDMFATAGKRQILVRMLLNLKRAYVRMRSFPQARAVTDLLTVLDASSITELRDRGLLAYHLEDFAAALGDLQQYLQLADAPSDDEERKERQQIWEHVKTLRRRIASFN